MGFLTLTSAGAAFLVIGTVESLSTSLQISPSDPRPLSSTPPSKTSSSKTITASPVYHLLLAAVSLLFILSSLASSLTSSKHDRVNSPLHLQTLAVSSLFFFYSLSRAASALPPLSLPLPHTLLDLILAFAFAEEFLLFYLQRKDTIGIENRYYDLMLLPIAVCLFSTLLGLKPARSARSLSYLRLSRGMGLVLQGTWFFQMSLSFFTDLIAHGCELHEKSGGSNYTIRCKGHPEYHRGRAIATLQFNCHLAMLVAVGVTIFSFVVKRSGGEIGREGFSRDRWLGESEEEVRYFQVGRGVGQFTLDSDEDNDDSGHNYHAGGSGNGNEIREEKDESKTKQGCAVEMSTINGHDSPQ
ncbi:hypothetical protein MLD38_000167 [Melastoma candidum]|uniref:Uncharacterized protein n=1 Tax=Melastoma candidum TaxID=119954 RepID=A0ACB9SB60_9MYRT|nr:hypothetical protein MLD38_000167 [Melastoma candidum]